MCISDFISIFSVKKIDPDTIAIINLLWQLFSWFMTYFIPPTIAICVAYYFGRRTFIAEKQHDRTALLQAREHEFIKKRYITEGLDKIALILQGYLAHYTFNHSIAIEVVGRCKTQRLSNNDKLDDLIFRPIDLLFDLSPYLRINNLLGDNIYYILMQLVNARSETYYYSRCLDILDLGKYVLANRESKNYKNYEDDLNQIEKLKESETDIFYRFHNVPFSLLVISDTLEKTLIEGVPLKDFRNNIVVKEQIKSMEDIFKNELEQYQNNRVRGDQLGYTPLRVIYSVNS